MINIDFLRIFKYPQEYETPEYYTENVKMHRYYNPVLKTQMDIADSALPATLVIAFFENRMLHLNDSGINEIHSNIDRIIETAIHYKRHELTVYFLDYKHTHDLYADPDWRL